MDTTIPAQNQNFSGDGKEFTKVSRAVGKAQSHRNRPPWNMANPVKNYHGIIVHQRAIGPRQIVLLKERYAESKKELLLQSGLDQKWWAHSLECYCYLRNVQDFLADEKRPCERGFGQPFKGSVIPFGSMVEHHPISAEGQSKAQQCVKKVLPGKILGYAGRIWTGDILVADIEELDNLDVSDDHARRLSAKESLNAEQW